MPTHLLLATLLSLVPAQQPAPDPRAAAAATANAQGDRIRRAEDLLERGDFKGAEPLLTALAADNPKNSRILFDLGFTQEHNGEDAAAGTSYTAAIAADPAIAEPHLALGLLEARAGHAAAARKQLASVTAIATPNPASKARALRALARLDQSTDPAQARRELSQAVQLTGAQPGDTELTASLAATVGNTADAETSFRQALAANKNDIAATAGLAGLLEHGGELAEADALLAPALVAHPGDPRLVTQAASLAAAEGKPEVALASLTQLRATDPEAATNPALTRFYAHLLLLSGDAAKAEPLYRQLAATQPADPTLLDDLGSTLVREGNFTEAQTVLTRAAAQRSAFPDQAAWGEAQGHLAFAASRNHQPEVVLQALHARATVLPNSPATMFLEATAHDSLRQNKEAIRAYRAFLAASEGKLPEEEFAARHRLVTLEHEH